MARAALSTAFAGLSGALGDLTIVQRPDGPVVRARVYRPRSLTPAQQESAARLRAVSQAWKALDEATYQAWVEYSHSREWRNSASGAIVTPAPYNLFSKLASKARQVDPSLSLVGFMPPAQAFAGDGVIVAVSPSSSGSSRRGGRGERLGSEPVDSTKPPPPSTLEATPEDPFATVFASPPSSDPPSSITNQMEEGVLVFSADRPNAPGIVTELLLQPLANARRAVYKDKYVSRGFVAFAEGSLSATVECPPGAYACAVRFVRAATGQETAIVPLGVVGTGGAA